MPGIKACATGDLEELMKFLTDFGDEAVILPLFVVAVIMFVVTGWRRGAIVWGFGVGLCLACLVLLKFAGLFWAQQFGVEGRAFSVSGHVAASTVVYGSLANMLLQPRKRSWFLALLPPLLIACVIGYTRLVLHAHTPEEVVSGAVLGILGASVINASLPEVPVYLVRFCVPVLLPIVLLFHGSVLEAEPFLQKMFRISYFSADQSLGW